MCQQFLAWFLPLLLSAAEEQDMSPGETYDQMNDNNATIISVSLPSLLDVHLSNPGCPQCLQTVFL